MWWKRTKKAADEEMTERQYTHRSRSELDDDFQRAPTVGLYEARLRAANKEAWTTSSKGWSEVLGRFSSKSK